jgi:hypothetical protein
MARDENTPEVIAELARQTAGQYGCQAVRWWQDSYNPHRLYIEVSYRLSTGQPFLVWISTLIPQQLLREERSGQQSMRAPLPGVRKQPRPRRDLLTLSSPQTHAASRTLAPAERAVRSVEHAVRGAPTAGPRSACLFPGALVISLPRGPRLFRGPEEEAGHLRLFLQAPQ